MAKIPKIANWLLPLIIITAVWWWPQSSAQASTKLKGVTISPYLQTVNIGNAPQTQFTFSITNNTSFSQDLNLSIVDFGSLDETGGVAFAGANENSLMKKYGLSSWLSLGSGEVQLKPSQSSSVVATITNRSDLGPGGHYAAILISTGTAGSGKNSIGVKQTVSSLVLATKQGGIRYDLSLNRVSTNSDLWHPPTKAVLRFYNPGNVHVVPRGLVKLMNDRNATSAEGVINQDSDYILPQTYRQIFVDMRQLAPRPWKLINSYKLEVDYRYDGINYYAAKTYTFRWVNVPALLALLLSISILGFVVYYFKKTYKNKSRRR